MGARAYGINRGRRRRGRGEFPELRAGGSHSARAGIQAWLRHNLPQRPWPASRVPPALEIFSTRLSLPATMTTPAHSQSQTPVSSGIATPPVAHGVGNPSGTPVVAPTRSKDPKFDGASGSLGTFGVSSFDISSGTL